MLENANLIMEAEKGHPNVGCFFLICYSNIIKSNLL